MCHHRDVDYRDIVPFIFWPWFFISCFVLIRRSLAKRSQVEGTAPPASPPGPLHGAPPVTSVPSSPAATLGSPFGSPTSTEDAPRPPVGSTGAPPPVSPGGSIFDTGRLEAPRPGPSTPARRSIAQMVQGIQLPAELVPLVEYERRPGAVEQAVFVTRSAPAGAVGQALGDELRRLGFQLTARHETEAVAARDGDQLTVSVHADPASVTRNDRPAFPAAGDGAVVVELWTG